MLKPAPKVDPNVEINGQVQKAAQLAQEGKFADARKIYEDLLVKYPSIYQLEGFIARTYAAESQPAKALEHLKIAMEKEPNDVDLKLLHADLLIESGDKAGARAILDAVDITKVKDPYPFMNAAITLINEKKGAEAIALLTKLLAQFPNQNEILLLPRPRVPGRREDGRGQGRPREVRDGRADREGSGRREEAHRAAGHQEVGAVKRLAAAMVLGLLISACGGSGSPAPSNPPPATSTDPCATAASKKKPKLLPRATPPTCARRKTNVLDGNPRWRVLDALWTHREAEPDVDSADSVPPEPRAPQSPATRRPGQA